jgi:hypothetical protein
LYFNWIVVLARGRRLSAHLVGHKPLEELDYGESVISVLNLSSEAIKERLFLLDGPVFNHIGEFLDAAGEKLFVTVFCTHHDSPEELGELVLEAVILSEPTDLTKELEV